MRLGRGTVSTKKKYIPQFEHMQVIFLSSTSYTKILTLMQGSFGLLPHFNLYFSQLSINNVISFLDIFDFTQTWEAAHVHGFLSAKYRGQVAAAKKFNS